MNPSECRKCISSPVGWSKTWGHTPHAHEETTAPLAHSSNAESSARASFAGRGGKHRKPLPVDLWEPEAREPAGHTQLSPQLQLSSISESVVAVCVLHKFEDLTWQVKEVSLSALAADSSLNAVTASHPGAAPLPLSTLQS
jgi:hypothetical protein